MKRKGYCLFCWLIIGIFAGSCSVYYNTADLNSNLSQFVKQVQNNYNTTAAGMKKLNNSYNQLHCSEKKDPFKAAREKLDALNQQLSAIADSKNEIEGEYTKYKGYSNGKSKISSSSEEWDLLKETKKKMKLLSEKVTSQAENFTTKANEFQLYTSTYINPIVKQYKTNEFKSHYSSIIEKLDQQGKENNKVLSQYQVVFKNLEQKYATKNPEEVNSLRQILQDLKNNLLFIKQSQEAIKKLLEKFNTAIAKKATFYNCEPLYLKIKPIEKELENHKSEIQQNQNKSKLSSNEFQKITTLLMQEQ